MKIGFNAMMFRHPATGSGQYLAHLVDALAETARQNQYIFLGLDAPPARLPGQANGNCSYIQAAVPVFARHNARLEKLAWEQLTAPQAARRAGVDLLHVPYFAPPYFSRTPVVTTIHDVIPLRLPAYRYSSFMRAYMRLVSRAAHRATLIITVSQHAKQDIIDALKLPAERIRVIYEAAGEEYRPITDAGELARVRARYGVGERFIFYLGGLDARKNVPTLVRAFAHVYRQLEDPDLQLLIAGNPDKKSGPLFPDPRPIAADLGMTGQIVYRYIEEEDKAAVYSAASVFVFPSLYEGFGLDPLEAMSCGAPVVCSNRTSLPEVVGDAALLFDPENTGQMAAAMRDVLANDELARDLRARSLRQAAKFNWRNTAQETLAVYEEAYQRGKSRK
jgi:glycosyltransferase involved in cell wall biosynthesis